jgi:hypothetical protein
MTPGLMPIKGTGVGKAYAPSKKAGPEGSAKDAACRRLVPLAKLFRPVLFQGSRSQQQ